MKIDGRHLSGSFSLHSRKSSLGYSLLHQHNVTVFTKAGLRVKIQSSCPTVTSSGLSFNGLHCGKALMLPPQLTASFMLLYLFLLVIVWLKKIAEIKIRNRFCVKEIKLNILCLYRKKARVIYLWMETRKEKILCIVCWVKAINHFTIQKSDTVSAMYY